MTPPHVLRLPLELLAEVVLINIENAKAECSTDFSGLPFPTSFAALKERQEPDDLHTITDPCVPFLACYTYRGAASNQAISCYMNQRPVNPVHINLYFACKHTRSGFRHIPEIWRRVAFWYPALMPQCINWISGTGTCDVVAPAPFCLCVRPYLHKVIGHARKVQFVMPYDGTFRPCDGIAACLMDCNDHVEELNLRFSLLEVGGEHRKQVICCPFPALRASRILNSHLVGYGNNLRLLHIGSETSEFRLPAFMLRTLLQSSTNLEDLCLQRAILADPDALSWTVTLPNIRYFEISDVFSNQQFLRDRLILRTSSTHVDFILEPRLDDNLQHIRNTASWATRSAVAFSSILPLNLPVASFCITPHDGWDDASPAPERMKLVFCRSYTEASSDSYFDHRSPALSIAISKDIRNPELEDYDTLALDTFIPLFITGVGANLDLNTVETLIFSIACDDTDYQEPYIPEFVTTIAMLTLFENVSTLVLPNIRGPTDSLHSLYNALSCCTTEAVGSSSNELTREDFLLGKIQQIVFPRWNDASITAQELFDEELEDRGRPVAVGVRCTTSLLPEPE